jgi:hypothetical protein
VPVPRGGPSADDRIHGAFAASHLRGLPAEVVKQVLDGARRLDAAAGDTLHRVGEGERHVELVVQGVVRVHASAPDGRTLTVRYCRTGALIGVLSLYAEPFVMPVTTQAGRRMATELFLRWVAGDEAFESFDPELRDRMLGNGEVLFGLEFEGAMAYLPTPDQLSEVRLPCVVAAGADNADPAAAHHWFYDASKWLADGLRAPLVETPGAHVPQATHPRALAKTLRPIIGELAASRHVEA